MDSAAIQGKEILLQHFLNGSFPAFLNLFLSISNKHSIFYNK